MMVVVVVRRRRRGVVVVVRVMVGVVMRVVVGVVGVVGGGLTPTPTSTSTTRWWGCHDMHPPHFLRPASTPPPSTPRVGVVRVVVGREGWG